MVLILLSVNGLFYYDKTSFTYWTVSSKSATYRKNKKGLADSRFEAYKKINEILNEMVDNFENRNKVIFLKHKIVFPLFEAFCTDGGFTRYSKFFLKSPRWAVETLSDKLMNYVRFLFSSGNSNL